MDSFQKLIAKRFRIARASRSQEEVADALDLKDRQSISAIERGERRITPQELIKAADFFGQPLSFFTDPYVVAEKNSFSYRAKMPDGSSLTQFENQAERVISANRRFRNLLNETTAPHHQQLRNVTKKTSFEEISDHGEQTALNWGQGDRGGKTGYLNFLCRQ
jgi:XRE family transcriptional regulator, fatty acid utilization regulator